MLLFVEDALEMIANRFHQTNAFCGALAGDWHASFVQNVYEHIERGRPLSTEQSRIVMKMVSKVGRQLVKLGLTSQDAIDMLIAHPSHRQPPYQSANIRKEVRYLGGNFLGFRFKFNDVIQKDIRMLNMGTTTLDDVAEPWFDRDFRIWVVPVIQGNLNEIRRIIAVHRFEMDITVRDYLVLIQCSENKPSTFVYDNESDTIIVNICDNDVLAHWIKHVAGGDWI